MKFRFCGDLDCPDWLLAEIAALSKLASSTIVMYSTEVVGCLDTKTIDYEKLSTQVNEGQTPSDIKGGISAIHFMIINAAKYDLNYSSLFEEIQQLGLPLEHAEIIANTFKDRKEALRAHLANTSYRTSKLLSSDWRVDHVIQSSDGDTSSQNDNNLIHFRLLVDTKPHLGPLPTAESSGDNDMALVQAWLRGRVDGIEFGMTPEKLDALIHELTVAEQTMDELLN